MLTERLTPLDSPLIIALGYKARHGKDTAAKYLVETYGKDYNIVVCSFASRLRAEVSEAVVSKLNFPVNSNSRKSSFNHSMQSAMLELCQDCDVSYDDNYKVDDQYPFGKQRALLEYWGQKRRASNPFYWVHKLEAQLISTKPRIAIITDLRYTNEANWVKYLKGVTVKVWREGLESITPHVSETQLDTYDFDYTVFNETGNPSLLHSQLDTLFREILESQS